MEAVDANSDAYAQGIRPGDVLTRAGEVELNNIWDLENAKTGLGVGHFSYPSRGLTTVTSAAEAGTVSRLRLRVRARVRDKTFFFMLSGCGPAQADELEGL